jgi:FkbM family methyltransferase
MVKLNILWKTLTITKNPIAVLSMKHGNRRESVTFRNGLMFNLTWPQFRVFRDSYSVLTEYSVVQLDDDLFRIKDQESTVVCSAQLMPLVCDLMRDFAVNQTEKDTFFVKKGNFQVVGSAGILVCVRELRAGEYDCDFQGKVVLDIGGFEGDSAAYFWSRNARKIIIYEPVEEHTQWIKKNIDLNKINAEVHQAGIGTKNGTKTIQYEEADIGFGLLNQGSKNMEIEIRDVSEVIQESGADIAKFDCEGAEESLVDLPAEILRKIDYYLVEVHSQEVREAILEKFTEAGFKLEEERCKSRFSILRFKRIDQ